MGSTYNFINTLISESSSKLATITFWSPSSHALTWVKGITYTSGSCTAAWYVYRGIITLYECREYSIIAGVKPVRMPRLGQTLSDAHYDNGSPYNIVLHVSLVLCILLFHAAQLEWQSTLYSDETTHTKYAFVHFNLKFHNADQIIHSISLNDGMVTWWKIAVLEHL